MSDSQYLRNNGDITVGHGTVQSVFDKDTWTMIVPCPQRTTCDVPPSKCSRGCYQRAPAELSPVEFTFHVSFLLAGTLPTPELFFVYGNGSHIIWDLRHRFQQMWSISMKNTFKDNYTILDTSDAHPEEVLTLLHFPNTAVFSNIKQIVVVMYFTCAPACTCMCLCMKLKLERLFWKAAIFFTLLQKIW